MLIRSLIVSLPLLAVVTACSPMPSTADSGAPGVRYVDAQVLTSGEAYSDAQVLTSVALHNVSAADAEARLQAKLPEGVRVSRVGDGKLLLLQGPGPEVTASIKELAKIDGR